MSQKLYVLQYADDMCLVSDGPASCAMLDFTDKWLHWLCRQFMYKILPFRTKLCKECGKVNNNGTVARVNINKLIHHLATADTLMYSTV